MIVAAAAAAQQQYSSISRCQANPNQLDLGPHCANRAFHRSMARENTVLPYTASCCTTSRRDHTLILILILLMTVILTPIPMQEMYRTLVEYGANPWAPNIHGDTPLLLACRRSLNMAQVILL